MLLGTHGCCRAAAPPSNGETCCAIAGGRPLRCAIATELSGISAACRVHPVPVPALTVMMRDAGSGGSLLAAHVSQALLLTESWRASLTQLLSVVLGDTACAEGLVVLRSALASESFSGLCMQEDSCSKASRHSVTARALFLFVLPRAAPRSTRAIAALSSRSRSMHKHARLLDCTRHCPRPWDT